MEKVKISKHPDKNASEEELERWLKSEGLSPYQAFMGPGDYAPPHEHEYDEIRVIVKGKIEFEVEGKKYILSPGERMDLASGTTHSARTIGTEKVVMLCASKTGKNHFVKK